MQNLYVRRPSWYFETIPTPRNNTHVNIHKPPNIFLKNSFDEGSTGITPTRTFSFVVVLFFFVSCTKHFVGNNKSEMIIVLFAVVIVDYRSCDIA